MAKKHNPYQLWLGLSPKFSNPNFFQLLGVDPRCKDEGDIKKKATAAAKSLVQKLKAVEVKTEAEKNIKQKMHAKIVLAHQTLTSPAKRQQYLKTMLAKASAIEASAVEGSAVEGSANTAITPASTASTNASQTPASPAPATPVQSSQDTPPVSKQPTEIPTEIPTAIPMAMPVTTPSAPVPTPANEVPDFSLDAGIDAPARNSEPDFDALASEPVVKVYATKRKTSRSWLVPLVVLVLIVGGIGGLVSMLTKYSNVFELIPGLKDKIENVAANDQNPATPGTAANSDVLTNPENLDGEGSGASALKVPDSPVHAIEYKGDEDPEMALPKEGMPPLVKRPVGSATKPAGGLTEPGGSRTKTGQELPNGKETVDDVDAKPLPAEELTTIRLAIHRSRDALLRQHSEMARHFNNDARNVLKRLAVTGVHSVPPSQQGLIAAVDNNDQVIDWVDDFWKQVKSASIEMAGGQEVVVGNKTMGLVEGRNKDVVLRIAGQNEFIPYRDLTPLLAITIGDMGSMKSVPRWNLAKAAYLGVMAEQYNDVLSLQARFLNQLKIDGFDVKSEVISAYARPDWLELGLPEQKLEPLDEAKFDEIIIPVRNALGYDDPSTVPVDRVDELIYRLTLNPQKDVATRVASLWESIALIKNGCRTFDLMFTNRELVACCTEVDFGRSFVDPILSIAKEKKDPSFQDQIARQTIIFVKRYDGNPNLRPEMLKQLIALVRKIGERLGSSQLTAMAEQLAVGAN